MRGRLPLGQLAQEALLIDLHRSWRLADPVFSAFPHKMLRSESVRQPAISPRRNANGPQLGGRLDTRRKDVAGSAADVRRGAGLPETDGSLHILHYPSNDIAFALHCPNHGGLGAAALIPLIPVAVSVFATDFRFIDFDNTPE